MTREYTIWYSGKSDIDGIPTDESGWGDDVNFYSFLRCPAGLGIYVEVTKVLNKHSYKFKNGDLVVVTWPNSHNSDKRHDQVIGGCRPLYVQKEGDVITGVLDVDSQGWNKD